MACLSSLGEFSGHRGAYWGPGMELGHDFHRLEAYYEDDTKGFLKECDRAWDGMGTGTKMVKCHPFALQSMVVIS